MAETLTYYLAHNFYTRRKIRKWEVKMEGKYNIILDNPFYDNPQRVEDMKILDSFKDGSKKQKEYLFTRDSHDIVFDDLDKIRKSDGIIAIDVSRVGTPMEIFFASRILNLPVYVIARKNKNHPWIIMHSTKIFSSRKELEEFIKKKFGVKR